MATISPIYDHFLDFMVEKATPEEILAYEILESERQRAIELLDKQDAGDLTSEESAELEQMVQVEQLVSALKARALAATSGK